MGGVPTFKQIPGRCPDRNNDECIPVEELEGSQQQKIRDKISEFVAYINKQMEFFNSVTRYMERKQRKAEEARKAAFDAFDSDRDGFITASELGQVMINLHAGLCDGDVEQMIQYADLDGDRRISYIEFQGIDKVYFGKK